jgi:hypothetical protein
MFKATQLVGFGAGGARRDPYFSSVVLLLNFSGGTATDKSNYARSVTIGSGSVVSSNYKWTSIGYAFDATSSGYMTIPDAAELDITGTFTLEAWIKKTGTAGGDNKVLDGDGGSSYRFGFKSDFGSMGGEGIGGFGGTTGISNGTYYHCCWERDASNVVRNYIDGSVVFNAGTITGTKAPDKTLGIMRAYYAGENASPAYLSELRLTIGVARYGGAFTAPAEPFPTN